MLDYLKTKCLSLGEEAKIIRRLEQVRLKNMRKAQFQQKTERVIYNYKVFAGLNEHRLKVVRPEARASNVAMGFLKGHAYSEIERISYRPLDWSKIYNMVEAFGEGDKEVRMAAFKLWKDAAVVYREKQSNLGLGEL